MDHTQSEKRVIEPSANAIPQSHGILATFLTYTLVSLEQNMNKIFSVMLPDSTVLESKSYYNNGGKYSNDKHII